MGLGRGLGLGLQRREHRQKLRLQQRLSKGIHFFSQHPQAAHGLTRIRHDLQELAVNGSAEILVVLTTQQDVEGFRSSPTEVIPADFFSRRRAQAHPAQ